MATEAMIIRLSWMVDDRPGLVKKRPDARLHESEMVTIGVLFAVRGGPYRPFSRWLTANDGSLVPALPDLTRLLRLLRWWSAETDEFLATPSCLPVADACGIEVRHLRREGRSLQHVGKQGVSNGRWIIGVNVGWVIKNAGKIVMWPWDTAKVSDRECCDRALASNHETIVLGDDGVRERGAPHEHMLFCAKGAWNERYIIETDVRWACVRCNTKNIDHRKASSIDARLGSLAALINGLLDMTPKNGPLLRLSSDN